MPTTSCLRHFRMAVLLVLPTALPVLAADPGGQQGLPAAASSDWWTRVQRSIELEEYGIVGEGVDEAPFRAPNPAHRFEAVFDTGGMRLKPTEEPSWEWRLALAGWGRPGSLEAGSVADVHAEQDRVEFDRGPLTEWFVNTPQGLEHGFFVPVRPRAEGDQLVFDLTITGGLWPMFSDDGQAIDFYSTGGLSVLHYGKLVVTDARGDGVPARMEPIVGGVRIVVDDSGAIYPLTVDPLATSASWTAGGEAVGNSYGYSVASAGDVNGDGYSDVAVGAYGHGTSKGKVYVYLGRANGLPATAAWTAVGESASNQFGWSVATAGDVNGDDYSDLIVAAPMFNQFAGWGKVYLYLGGASGLAATPAWTRTGLDNDGLGYSVASAGDVNGDGKADVVIGSMAYSVHRGRAQLFLGAASGLSATPSWTKPGEQLQDEFGGSVASAGDVNEDGYADVVIGAAGYPGGSSEFPLGNGRAYLFLGGAGGLSATASWTATGERQSANFGISVASAGDVNADGNADVIVGAHQMTGGGRAYLYFGGANGLPAAASWTAGGGALGSYFGCSVASAGDVNHDGYSDTVIGDYGNSTDRGKAYVYLGGASGPPAVASWTAVGEVTLQRFGGSVASAGDVNGDGYADVVVGAYRYVNNTGKAYLYLGGANGPCTTPSAALFISGMNRIGGKPILTYQDPNLPGAVTGYNVYRAPAPTGPWSLVGSNVGDTDLGTPGLQYLDQSGDIGAAWYYKVAAFNATCGVEGP